MLELDLTTILTDTCLAQMRDPTHNKRRALSGIKWSLFQIKEEGGGWNVKNLMIYLTFEMQFTWTNLATIKTECCES